MDANRGSPKVADVNTCLYQSVTYTSHVYVRQARCRWRAGPGRWEVRGRVERFVEPCLLLLLRERPGHGYDLLARLPAVLGEEAGVGLGNLYRILRALEIEGVVASRWDAGAPGPARRTYRLTSAGGRLLDQWAEALRRTRTDIDHFLGRHERTA